MRKFLGFCFLILCTASLYAQTTSVTGTITDSNSVVWANSSWTLSFVPSQQQPNINAYTIGGVPLSSTVINQTGVANSSGVFSFTAYQIGSINPSGGQFKLVICPTASVPCSQLLFTTGSNSSLDLSSQMTATFKPPSFVAVPGTFGYNDSEATLALRIANSYFNISSNTLRIWSGVSWISPGGSGSFTAGGDLSGSNTSQTVIGINNTLLSGLSTGLLKNTTGTGKPSIAISGTDYLAPGLAVLLSPSGNQSITQPITTNLTFSGSNNPTLFSISNTNSLGGAGASSYTAFKSICALTTSQSYCYGGIIDATNSEGTRTGYTHTVALETETTLNSPSEGTNDDAYGAAHGFILPSGFTFAGDGVRIEFGNPTGFTGSVATGFETQDGITPVGLKIGGTCQSNILNPGTNNNCSSATINLHGVNTGVDSTDATIGVDLNSNMTLTSPTVVHTGAVSVEGSAFADSALTVNTVAWGGSPASAYGAVIRAPTGGTSNYALELFTATGTTNLFNVSSAGVGAFNSFVQASKLVTSNNCFSIVSPASCTSAAAGSVVIASGQTSIVVNTTAVTGNSQIFLTEDQSLGTRLSVTCDTTSVLTIGNPIVTARTSGTSFTIGIAATTATNPVCLSFNIVN